MIRWIVLILLLAPVQQASLEDELDKLVRAHGLDRDKIGIAIHSTNQRKTLHRRIADRSFLLASNTKLLTCAAALDLLGPDYTFETAVHIDEKATALVVTGTGDPHISGRDHDDNPTAVFERWADKIKEKGFDKIDGPIRLVADKFEHPGTWPEWKRYPIDRWWAAPFGQFSFNDNCIDVHYRPGAKVDDPLRLTIKPDTRFVTIRNETRTVQSTGSPPFQFTRKPGTNDIRFRGVYSIRNRGGTTWVAIQNPQEYFGWVLKETLERKGIEISGGVEIIRKPPEGLTEIARHRTRLSRILEVCLTVSQNFYAEMIFLHLGWKKYGKGTRENGRKAVRAFLKKAGLKKTTPKDGSGLTRENRSTPEDLVKLLKYMKKHKDFGSFYRALAVNGGKIGTLRRRMTDERYAGRVHAKTGHIAGVASLSGYIESENDDVYIFSVLVNIDEERSTRNGDRLQDRICELLVRWKP